MLLSIKVSNIDIKEYNICEYAIISIYMPSNNDKVILIYREIYIINNLSIKALIKINIIKSKNIILDIFKNLTIIELYKDL